LHYLATHDSILVLTSRTQFTLLQSSLNPNLQASTLSLLLSSQLTPSELAVLPSSRLASQARYDEDQAAQQEILRQTVRLKNQNADGGLRVGPDGFEQVKDVREVELQREREREEERRREGERRREEKEREEEERYGGAVGGEVKAKGEAKERAKVKKEGEDEGVGGKGDGHVGGGSVTAAADGDKVAEYQSENGGAKERRPSAADYFDARSATTAQTGAHPGSATAAPDTVSDTHDAKPASPSGSLKRKASAITSNPPSPSKPMHKRPSFDLRSAWSGAQVPTMSGSPTTVTARADEASSGDSAAENTHTGAGALGSGTEEQSLGVDQTVIDLSDVVGFGADALGEDGAEGGAQSAGKDLNDDPLARMDEEERQAQLVKEERDRYAAKPVVWRGRVSLRTSSTIAPSRQKCLSERRKILTYS
jgi:hypothetical protein